MTNSTRLLPERIFSWVASLSLPILALGSVLIAAGVIGGGYYAFRTYNYVQHDNEFCFQCHLMKEPFGRFEKSAHRGLGCKACHQPNIFQRTRMGLTAIVENPDTISQHAGVPNERCAACHIKGDPKKWDLISNSAGHRIHLESKDSTLQGLMCVECHGASLHEFTPTDRTCTQAGCHDENNIQLGGMSDLTVHCEACHEFKALVPPGEGGKALEAAVRPGRDECLSCHAMRTQVNLPDPDPHGGKCSSCHNPHTQKVPADAVQSCTKSGCHTQVDTVTAFHRGLEPGVLENCTECHKAHDFRVEWRDCVTCHQGILDDKEGGTIPAGARHPGADTTTAHGPGSPDAARFLHVAGAGIGWASLPSPPQERPLFRHSQHREVVCVNCHESRERHGGLTVTTLADCRSCHHTEPRVEPCSRCHTDANMPRETFRLSRTLSFSVEEPVTRDLPFRHEVHTGLECRSCHQGEGAALSAEDVDCRSCHEDHHRSEVDCRSCHVQVSESAHPPEVHVGCGGSGCHQDVPVKELRGARSVCVVCHQDKVDHQPERACDACHVLPHPRRGIP